VSLFIVVVVLSMYSQCQAHDLPSPRMLDNAQCYVCQSECADYFAQLATFQNTPEYKKIYSAFRTASFWVDFSPSFKFYFDTAQNITFQTQSAVKSFKGIPILGVVYNDLWSDLQKMDKKYAKALADLDYMNRTMQVEEVNTNLAPFMAELNNANSFSFNLNDTYVKNNILKYCSNIDKCAILKDNTMTLQNTKLPLLPFNVPDMPISYDLYSKEYEQGEIYPLLDVRDSFIVPLLSNLTTNYKRCPRLKCYNMTGYDIISSTDTNVKSTFKDVLANIQSIMDNRYSFVKYDIQMLANYTLTIPGEKFTMPVYNNWPKINFKYADQMKQCNGHAYDS